MQPGIRRALDFASGLLVGGIAVAALWQAHPVGKGPPVAEAVHGAAGRPSALLAAADRAGRADHDGAAASPDANTDCAFEPLLVASSRQDARFAITPALALDGEGHVRAYMEVAQQAAKEHRMRDSEVALIVACRLAARQPGAPSVQLADVQERLADHYAAAAEAAPSAGARARIWARARGLFEASLQTYMTVLGRAPAKVERPQARAPIRDGAHAGPSRPAA